MLNILSSIYTEEFKNLTTHLDFELNQWNRLLTKLYSPKNYDKGKSMENLANYFFRCIDGIQIRGRNIRHFTEEIDLCFCNYSNDSTLWKLGPVVLVECKNHKKNIPAKTIRNLNSIMESKGISTTILFTASPLSKASLQEVEKAKNFGKYFIVFSFDDLLNINSTPLELLKIKIEKTFLDANDT